MADPKWLGIARKYLGTKETPGPAIHPTIKKWFQYSGHKEITDDVTAWCAAFVNGILYEAGQKGTGALNARSFLNWGKALKKPVPGAIVVFKRGNSSWQGHVAFFLRDLGDKIEVLGGNQSDSVSIARYKKADLLGYRWPDTVAGSTVIKSTAVTSVVGGGLTVDNGVEVVQKLQEADGYVSAGTWFGLAIGLTIVAVGLWGLHARWAAGGKPLPSWTPYWVRKVLNAP